MSKALSGLSAAAQPRAQHRYALAVIAAGLVGLAAWGITEFPYIDWHPVAAPVEGEIPLKLRHDAKGSGFYGAPRSGGREHHGIDLAAPRGSPVYAIRSGRVVEAGQHRGLGRYVELRHRRGLSSLYAHLDEVLVRAGDRVRQGQPIGSVGKTGNARHPWIMPHLHLEVAQGRARIDPSSLGFVIAGADSGTGSPPDASGGE